MSSSLPTLRCTVFTGTAASQEKAKQGQNGALALAHFPVCLPPLMYCLTRGTCRFSIDAEIK
jgi:hypothetical protein